jgi:hypothetical protein
MRRLSLAGLAAVLAVLVGCDAMRDAFSPRAEVAARANDETLTVERLAEIAGSGKQVPLELPALTRLARVWADYTLFAQAVATGTDLRDSATAFASMWPLVSQLKWERFHEQAVRSSAALSTQQLDSAYQMGDVRLFQHILFQVPPNSAPAVDAQKKRQADQLLPRARSAGARFGQMARQFSEDPGTRVQGGALGVFPRGQFVQVFEDAAWALGPGDVSPVVKSPFGYHIIRRPPLAEVRDSFRTGVEERALMRADSLYVDSLSISRKITPVKKAPDIVRQTAQDLDGARSNDQTVVKYRGGAFRVRDVARWLSALDPQVLQALPQATDEQINQFLKVVVQRQLLIEQADSAGTALTAEETGLVRTQHDSTITILASVLNVTPSALGDSATTPESRRELARARVEDYLGRVVQGRARFFPLPPFLAETLRDRGESSVNQSGVRRALERAREVRAAMDSVQAPGQAPPGGGPQLRPNPDTTRSR